MKTTILIYLLLIFSIGKTTQICPDAALSRCTCGYTKYNRDMYYVVNCTDTGFTDTEMLEKIPPQTQVIVFTGNNIPELPWNVFGDFDDLKNLSIIDMSNNNIREIKGKSYHHVSNVHRLILNNNNLRISDSPDEKLHHKRVFSNFVNLLELHLTNAFADNTDSALANDLHDIFVNSNLSKLYKIHLEQNEIKGFRDVNVFCDLPSIRDIYLGDNDLTGILFNVSCLKKLRFLDLEQNRISKFTDRELRDLDLLSFPHRNESLYMDVSGNPFRCDETIRNLFMWMQETNVTIRNKDTLECHLPKYGKRYIMNLKHMFDYRKARVSNAITILLVILIIILVSLLGALAYLSREKLTTKFKPIIDVVSRKVQYTTIESQDV